ncbi:uncharacterized protein PHACADRAFT_254742 [Phanerochaete carnosa HHB-10118-sp]|uniref:Alcohol dehydrogenase-like C-terminal domain-containing protein n=1 Tax=Phanerochaete carnosa (strain HHB-10118-sp) TaxID=650164 RepID=K5X2X9_PHACS|nr:uncharacterized protein PHACADRAFT_254742 [Phanerochaete carnosa HHB-10118-sp]EKM57162.1 hypothetical protein PHACADRAFT_254742 [Phanerochaete carnosa HHB-10118-sp]
MFASGGAGPVGKFVIQCLRHISTKVESIASAGSTNRMGIVKNFSADVALSYKEENTCLTCLNAIDRLTCALHVPT